MFSVVAMQKSCPQIRMTKLDTPVEVSVELALGETISALHVPYSVKKLLPHSTIRPCMFA